MSLSVYYDGDCPFCARYVTLLRLKATAGEVTLCNLRDDEKTRYELIEQGFDLDKGMVVDIDGRRLGGSDAINSLALLSTPINGFNKLNKWMMSSPILAALLYPILRAGRWLILFLLGRNQIMDEDQGASARAGIFGTLFSLFSFFHFFNYLLEYGRIPPQLDQFAILICATLLFFKPRSERLLWLLMLVSTVSAIVQAPVSSNHTIVRNFVVLGYWMSFFYVMLKGKKWSDIFTNFTVAGQGCLLVMYFFGVFHKINTDFLNPETSCAVTLWREMPAFLNWIDYTAMHYIAIYGTFIVETVLVLMLFFSRYRHTAVVCGILFHLLLALSNYAMYISFTTLAISLHCLFLNEESAMKIQNSNIMRAIRDRKKNPIYIVTAFILVCLVFLSGLNRQYSMVTIFMLPVLLPFCFAIIRHGSSTQPLLKPGNRMSATVIGGSLTALFFANCWMPYLGLKTAQTVNMFANIRLEAGVSNHLIMKSPPGPFKYLNDVVLIEDVQGESTGIFKSSVDGLGIVYYNLLADLERNPLAKVSYVRNGVLYKDMTAEKLSEDIKTILHPAWFRKWFHFQRADVSAVEYCQQ